MKIRLVVKNPEEIGQTSELARQIIGASILDLDADLRRGSPVDTGYFVNSWQAQANGSPAPRDGFASQDRGGSDPAVIFGGIGGVVSLVNTAVYAEPLAHGHSPQAPDGWVESTANRLQDHVDRNAIEARRR